jgi:hypothetical protein
VSLYQQYLVEENLEKYPGVSQALFSYCPHKTGRVILISAVAILIRFLPDVERDTTLFDS